jgi:hypothetical protein
MTPPVRRIQFPNWLRSSHIQQFNVRFSPLRDTFATLRMVVDEQAYERLVAARDPSLDPGMLGGFFPPYRSA